MDNYSILNIMHFTGPNEKALNEMFCLMLASNNCPYTFGDEKMIIFSTPKALSLKRLMQISSKFPNNYFFWSYYSSETYVEAVFRIKNGKILKKKITIPNK